MKSAIISVFLLSLLLPIASSLLCYQCKAKNSKTCEQKIVECPEGEQCLTISEEYKLDELYYSIYKDCSGDLPCNVKPYGKSSELSYLLYNIKCCNEDCCNEEFYEMPPDDLYNGLVCPSCLELGTTEECTADNMTMCQGEQDKCVNSVGVAVKPDGDIIHYGVRGCVSSATCSFALNRSVGVQVMNLTIHDCTGVSARPPTDEEKEELGLAP